MRLLLLSFLMLSTLFAQGIDDVEKLFVNTKIQHRPIIHLSKDPFIFYKKKVIKVTDNNRSKIEKKSEKDKQKIKKEKPINIQWIYGKKALIDNNWFKEGDMIYEKKIIAIYKTSIILKRKNKTEQVVRLKKPQTFQLRIGNKQ